MEIRSSPKRKRATFRLDGDRLREERVLQYKWDPKEPNKKRFTQEEMAEKIGIGLSAYVNAEKGECIDESIARRIIFKLDVDETDLGLQPCSAPPPPVFTRYLAHIRDECGFIEVRGIVDEGTPIEPIPIADLYIPLTTTGAQDADGSNTLESAIKTRLLLVIGDPGSGKSISLRKAAWERTLEGATQFPIFIRISELEAHIRSNASVSGIPSGMRAGWFKHYLAARSDECGWGLNAEDFHRKLRESSTVVLLDGLDEAPDSQRRAAMARLFLDAVRVYANAHFIVTTRPAASEFEGLAANPEFRKHTLRNFDARAREQFIRQWSRSLVKANPDGAKRHSATLISAVEARPAIRRMANNPLMLTTIAVVHWNQKTLPEQRADLFESILKWLARAREKVGRLPAEDCLRILSALALAMQCRPGGRVRQISLGEAAGILAERFQRDEHGQVILPARRAPAALDFLEKEMVDSGIVVRRGHTLEFWHLTFQEYLAARSCRGLLDADLLTVLFNERRLHSPEWREVMLLLGGVLIHLGPEKVDAIFRAVLDEADRDGSLTAKARAVGLLGAMLRDLRPSPYHPFDSRYDVFLKDALGVFELSAANIPLKIRIEAAEALGQAGDPRLRDPRTDDDYWVKIPAGKSWMGAQKSNPKKPNYDPEAEDDEGPVRRVELKAFRIGRYPVTVQEFSFFLEDTKRDSAESAETDLPGGWDTQVQYPNRPVTGVTWYRAQAFCAWAGCRLPTEEEWEFAARGTEGRKYPWGNEPPDTTRANYSDANIHAATPVGLFPNGATPESIDDMAGNVWEWTSSDFDKESKVVRGASFGNVAVGLRAALRGRDGPGYWYDNIGFRCVRE